MMYAITLTDTVAESLGLSLATSHGAVLFPFPMIVYTCGFNMGLTQYMVSSKFRYQWHQ
jgi:hypothetical protein